MDKQKQIEEMAKDRIAELRLFYNFCKYNGCEEKTAEDCENCYFRKVYNRLAELEGEIRNGTLKEIPENAVVLTNENEIKQYEWSKMLDKMGVFKFADKVRKETAEKFAERLKALYVPRLNEWDEISVGGLCFEIDEICKEITEGKV